MFVLFLWFNFSSSSHEASKICRLTKYDSHPFRSASQLFMLISQGHLNTFCMKPLKLSVPFYIFIKLLINILYHSFYWALSYIQNATCIQIVQAVCITRIKVHAIISIHNTKAMKKWPKCCTYHNLYFK